MFTKKVAYTKHDLATNAWENVSVVKKEKKNRRAASVRRPFETKGRGDPCRRGIAAGRRGVREARAPGRDRVQADRLTKHRIKSYVPC